MYRWRYPYLWILLEGLSASEASLLGSTREKRGRPGGSHSAPGALQKSALCLLMPTPDAALRGCWHKTLGKAHQLKHPSTTQHAFLCVLMLEMICAPLANSTHWAGINISLLICSASSHTPTVSCVMPKPISTCTPPPICNHAGQMDKPVFWGTCCPEQLVHDYKLLGSAATLWLLWAWLHCSADLSPTHLPAADRASPHLLGRARKL